MSDISRRTLIGAAALGGLSVALTAGCSSGPSAGTSQSGGAASGTFKILQYEDQTSGQAKGWKKALEIFKAEHPGVTVDYQQTSFDAMRQNAKITLAGNDVPDVVEFNKGNADGGQLAAQGLLTKLTDQVSERGWDKKVTGSMQSFAKYTDDGEAGDGDWYGIPNIGEYVMLYYNKDLFKKAGVTGEPQSIAELEHAMDKLLSAGITPISSSAATSQGFNQMWIWYSLVSAYATRQQIDDFMFVRAPVDFSADPWSKGANQFEQWIRKGYTGEKISGLNFEQATLNFIGGKAAMLCWNQGTFQRMRDEVKFNWGYFTFPGANLAMGSSGHLWGVPSDAKNKDLAYDWIDTTLRPEVQNLMGNEGALPIAGDTSTITDEVTREFTRVFDDIMAKDRFSFYPDYPVNGFLDFIQAGMQKLSNKNLDAAGWTKQLQEFYDKGTKS